MKKLVIIGMSALAFAGAADAACTKKSLNGNWMMAVNSQAAPGVLTGGTINVSFGGTPVSFTITSFNSTKCKGTGTGSISGTSGTMNISAEDIPGSSAKPNTLFVTITTGSPILFTMQRQ